MAKPLDSRFWSKVDCSGGVAACWLWRASTNQHGYGRYNMGGRKGSICLAHRVVWEDLYGGIVGDLDVCHHCDTPACVNPYHLFLGTAADNGRDMAAKNRSTLGERNAAAKLTDEQVLTIRRLRASYTQRALAQLFGVTHGTINYVTKHGWRHLEAA